MNWNNIIDRCCELLDTAYNEEIAKIRTNLELGKVLHEILKSAKYGDRAVERLASDLSRKRVKTVYPQRLYEAYEVYSAIRTIEKVSEIQGRLTHEITWNWLVKNSTKEFPHEENHAARKEKIQRTLKNMENLSEKLELVIKEKEHLDEDEKKQAEGVVVKILEIAREFGIGEKPSTTAPDAKGTQFVSSETGDNNMILLEYIRHDELTGEEAVSDLEIHILEPDADIGKAIVISNKTHRQIHEGLYPLHRIESVINERNVNLATLFLSVYLDTYPTTSKMHPANVGNN